MLVLSRKVGERIVMGHGLIHITVLDVEAGKVSLGFDAPEDVVIDREEVHQEKQGGRDAASNC